MRSRLHVIICARRTETRRWIAEELADGASAVVMDTLSDAIQVLSPRKRHHVLVVDVDELDAQELVELHMVRSFGWRGTLIALGHVPEQMHTGLQIDHVVKRPFGSEALRAFVSGLDATVDTAEITLVDG